MPLAIVFVLFALQVLLFFVHLAVYATVAAIFGIGGMPLKIAFIILSFTFLSASLLAYRYRNRMVDWYYTAAAYWFGLVCFLFVGAVVFFLAANVLYRTNHYVSPELLGGIALGAFFLLHCYGTWESGRARTTLLDIALPDLPASWRGKRFVFVSDLHLGNVRRQPFALKVTRKIQALHPEAVFIGGDLYDGPACDVKGIIEPLRALHAPRGIYFVTGNHEYFLRNLPSALAAVREAGIRILNNERVDLGGIAFFGVDHNAVKRRDDFKKIIGEMNISKEEPSILIKHEPNFLDVAKDAGISFVLSGHTHQGQIFPLNFLTRQIYGGFDYGLRQLRGMQVYTSSGVGTWGPPLRLGTKSEIVCVTVR